ncbi:MAG: hypothetical protein AAB515_02290 [Patescibacteria group bacterium]
MQPQIAPQATETEAVAPDPRAALLRQAFELSLPFVLALRTGQKQKLNIPGVEIEMLSNTKENVCFMLDVNFKPEAN